MARGRDARDGARSLRRILTLHALGHWQIGMPCEDHSPAHASKPRDARHLMDRGTTRRYSRAPAWARQGGPSPEERHPVYPQKIQ